MSLIRWSPRRGLVRRRPSEMLTAWEREMDDLFESFFRRFWPASWMPGEGIVETRGWAPAIDLIDREKEVVARVELPGLKKEDLSVAVENNVLTVEGERKAEEEVQENDYYCCERRYGKFYRSIGLPVEVDEDKVTATYQDGVLEIHLPKTEEVVTIGRKIPIQ